MHTWMDFFLFLKNMFRDCSSALGLQASHLFVCPLLLQFSQFFKDPMHTTLRYPKFNPAKETGCGGAAHLPSCILFLLSICQINIRENAKYEHKMLANPLLQPCIRPMCLFTSIRQRCSSSLILLSSSSSSDAALPSTALCRHSASADRATAQFSHQRQLRAQDCRILTISLLWQLLKE